jgi:hypothetical protein
MNEPARSWPRFPGQPPVPSEQEVLAVHGVLGAVVIVGGSLLLTLLVIAIVRRLISHQTLARHNDVAGFVYATTGVIYAVLKPRRR